jgi:hypothetical protein
MNEVFIPIIGFEKYYEISNLGRVKSIRKNIIKKVFLDKDGYERITLTVNQVRYSKIVHRLVALNFISNDNNLVVNHINGIKTDNKVTNLELVTILENNLHCIKNRLRKPKLVKSLITNEILTRNEWAAKLNVSVSMIDLMKKNKRKNNLKLTVYE